MTNNRPDFLFQNSDKKLCLSYLIDTCYCSSNSYNGPKKFTHIFAGLTCELRSLVLENPAINQFKHSIGTWYMLEIVAIILIL